MPFITGEQLKGFVIGTVKQAVLSLIGNRYPDVDDSYKVTVFNHGELEGVVLLLQENIHMTVSSNWASPLPIVSDAGIQALVQYVTQGGYSATFATCSRRVWVGSEPVGISLPLLLIADDLDVDDIVDKVRFIQSLTLPAGKTLLRPPGPYIGEEFAFFGAKLGKKGMGERVSISVGKFLRFDNVVVKSVSVDFENRMSQEGKPTFAKVVLNFETYEMLTRDKLRDEVYKTGITPSEYKMIAAEKRAAGDHAAALSANKAWDNTV